LLSHTLGPTVCRYASGLGRGRRQTKLGGEEDAAGGDASASASDAPFYDVDAGKYPVGLCQLNESNRHT
jgi:hypothetical protein